MIKTGFSYFFKILILLAVYFITAWAGLQFGAVSGFATLVWPPAGIALAAILLFGYKYWPGIFFGAFLVNWSNGAPIAVAAGIAIGNTLEAYFAAYLLRNSAGFKKSLETLQDVLRFLVFGAFLSTLVAATVGTASLFIGRVIEFSAFADTWLAWWIGDMLGIQMVGALLLVWFGKKIVIKADKNKIIEGFFLALLLFIFGFLVFGYLDGQALPITYIVFIPVIWAAINFGQRGVVTVVGVLSVISIWGTLAGSGPFVEGSLSERLLYLQVFMGTLSGVGLILASVVAERREKEKLLKELNQELEERVEKRTFELRRAQEVIDNSFEGVMIANGTQEHLIQYVNKAWEKITGWKSEEVIGKSNPRILKSGKTSIEFYKKLWETILSGNIFSAEITNKRRDGSFYDAEISIIPIKSKEGVSYYAEISRDITERKKIQTQLTEYTKGLETMVAERTKELEEKVDDLEKLNKFMVGRELRMIELKDKNKDLMISLLKHKHPKITKKK